MLAPRLKIYVVTHDILGDIFWEVFRQGLRDAAQRYDVDVEHLRPGKFSPKIQAGLIDSAVEARPDGIISTIPDVEAIDPALRKAVARGIPVIAINAKDPRPPAERIPYLFYVGGDDTNAGQIAGEYLISQISPQAGMCVDHYLYDHICHSDRHRGFEQAFRAAGLACDRLRVPGGDAEACAAAVAEYLHAHPQVDAVLTLGPPGAQAVLKARNLVRPDRVWSHVTFDVAPLQLDGIRSGAILATIDSQQYLQGYLSVLHMWLHVTQGFTMTGDIFTGPAIVNSSNIAAAEEGVRRGIR